MVTSINDSKSKFDLLENKIVALGQWAVKKQKDLHIRYKEDNSPVTEVDERISREIVSLIKELFPECSIISEEEYTERIINPPLTFVLDPIDGTDVYSQGIPSFAISLGVLDSSFTPIGAIVYAPRFGRGDTSGLLLRLDLGGEPTINGKKLIVPNPEEKKNTIKQITISSSLVKYLDFSSFEGKVRIFGSQILQILSPSIFSNITASINEPCYIWDYAGAHAIIKSLGMDIYTKENEVFTYSEDFLRRKKAECITYCGYKESVEKLISLCPEIDSDRVMHF